MSSLALRTVACISSLAAVLALSACAGTSNGANSSSTGEAMGGELSAVAGFDSATNTISVGYITALTIAGAAGAGGLDQLAGQKAYWKLVNDKGGINGKYKVKVIPGDNQANANLTLSAYSKMKDDIVMLTGVVGSQPVNALVPVLNSTDSIAIPSAQNSSFRTNPALAPIFSTFQTDVIDAVDYAVKSRRVEKSDRFCAAVEDQVNGTDRIAGLKFIAGKLGLHVGKIIRFDEAATNYTSVVQALQSAKCQVVVFGGGNHSLPIVAAEAEVANFAPTWISVFYAVTPALAKSPSSDYISKQFLFTGLAGNLNDKSIPGIVKLTKALGKTPTMQNVYGFVEGYAAEAILKQAIRDGGLAPKTLRKAATQVKTVTFDGLNGKVTWGDPGSRTLPKTTTIFVFDPSMPGALRAVKVQYQAPSNTGTI